MKQTISLFLLLLSFTFSTVNAENVSKSGFYYKFKTDEESISKSKLGEYTNDFRSLLRNNKTRYLGIKVDKNIVSIKFKKENALKDGSKLLKQHYGKIFNFSESNEKKYYVLNLSLSETGLETIKQISINNIISILKKRSEELGLKNAKISALNNQSIEAKVYDVTNFDLVNKILNSTLNLEFQLLDEKNDATTAQSSGNVPRGSKLIIDSEGKPFLIKRRVLFNNDSISNAEAIFYQASPAIKISFNKKAIKTISKLKENNLKSNIAILKVVYQHKITQQENREIKLNAKQLKSLFNITNIKQYSNHVIIELGTFEEAQELALLLRSGSIKYPYYLTEELLISSNGIIK